MKRQGNFRYFTKKICSVTLALALSTSLAPTPAFAVRAADPVSATYEQETESKVTPITNTKVEAPVASYDFTSGELGKAVVTGAGATIAAGTGVTLSGNATSATQQYDQAAEITNNAQLTIPGIENATASAVSILVDFQTADDYVNYSSLFQVGTELPSEDTQISFSVNEAGQFHGRYGSGTWIDMGYSGTTAEKGKDAQSVIVIDNTGKFVVYFNGVKTADGNLNSTQDPDGLAAAYQTIVNDILQAGIIIGGNSSASSNTMLSKAFNGTVKAVNVYDYAINAEQAKAIYEKAVYIPAADYTYSFDNAADKAVAVVHPEFATKPVELATQPSFTYVDSKDGSKAIKLDGTYGLRLDDIPSSNRNAYSYSFWINAEEFVNNTPIVSVTPTEFGQGETGGEAWSALAGTGTTAKFWSLNNNTQSVSHTTAGTASGLETGKWAFVTVSVDDSKGEEGHAEAVVYVDGKKVISGDAAGDTALASGGAVQVYIGANAWDGYFKGTIDDFSFYSEAFDDAQAAALYEIKSVSTPATGVELTAASTEILVGDTTQLTAAATPKDTTDKYTIAYESLTPEIATVDEDGKVTAVAKGDATIKATLTTLSGASFDKTIEIKVIDLADVEVPTPIALYRFQGNMINAVNGKSAQLTGSLVQDAATIADPTYTKVDDNGTQAIQFSGADSYGVLLDADSVPKTNKFTISYKVKVNDSTQYAAQLFMANVLSEGETGDTTYEMTDGSGRTADAHARFALGRGWQDESMYMIWSNSGADKWGDVYSAKDVQPNGEWATFTTVFDGNNATIYKNGEKLALTSANGVTWENDGTAAIYLGVNYWDTPFNGEIYDLAIYDGAFTSNQIAALFSDARVDNSAVMEKATVGQVLLDELAVSKAAYKEPAGGWDKFISDLTAAVTKAKEVKDKADATQDEINAAAKAVADLTGSLERVSLSVKANYNSSQVTVEGLVDSQNYGKAIQFSAAAAAGYNIDSVTFKAGNGEAKTLTPSSGNYTIPAEEVTGDIEINIATSAKEYTITYKIDGATVSDDAALNAVSKFTIESDTFALPQPTAKAGYTFKGWFSNSGMTTEIASIEKGTKKNITVYGAWEENSNVTPQPGDKVAVTKVTLNAASGSIKVGGTVKLTATVTPDNATNKTVTWASKDTSIATVKDGVVTGVKAGTTTITATADGKTAEYKVTVTAASSTTKKQTLKISKITNKAKGKKAVSVKTSAKSIKAKKGSVIKITAKQTNIGKKITASVPKAAKNIITVKTSYKAKTGKATIKLTVKKKVKKNVKVTIKCGTKKLTKTIKVVKK